jgi:hypothetical protein
MKKLFISLLAVSMLLTSCHTGASEDTTAELPASKDENDRFYEYVEFPSTNQKWQLIYDDNYNGEEHSNKLLLTNGEKTFVYGDFRGVENPAGYDIQFSPLQNKDSAEVTISEDEKYAAIIYDGATFSVSEPKHDRILLVSLDDGKPINFIDIRDREILEANNISYSVLDKYQSDGTKKVEYVTYLQGRFEGDILNITAYLVTDDNEVNVFAGYTYNITENELKLK